MLHLRGTLAVGLIALGILAGCDAYPLQPLGASDEEAFMAVGVSGIGGADGLSARANTVASEAATVSLSEEILGDVPDEAFLAVDATEIAVVVSGGANGRAKPAAKARKYRATIMFRLAHENQDACDALDQVGPFELTIADGAVTLAEESLPLDASARSVVRNGRFEMCAETWADFDGSISVGQMSFEFGRLRGNEERVILCHAPPDDEQDARTITVGSSSVEAHLGHGDYLGECEEQDGNPPDDDMHDDGDEDADGDAADDDHNGDPDGDEEGGADDKEDGNNANENDADDTDSDDEGADNSDDDEDGVDDEGDADSDDGQDADDGDVDDDDSDDLDDDDEDGDTDDDGDAGGGDGASGGDDAGGTPDADGDGVSDDADACLGTPVGDDVDANGCTLVTIDADAGPDIATIVGVAVDVVAAATVLTGDYDEAALVFVWEQVAGDAVALEVNGPSLRVDTTGATGDVVFRVTASTADGFASGSDEYTITLDTDAIPVDSASCDPATGHCYILARKSDGSNDRRWWDDAKATANKMVHNGMRGHLPTITSLVERQFLAGVAGNTPAMIGGTDREEEGVWKWADGPEAGQLIEYLPWADAEPNDLYHWTYPEGEDYLQHEARGFNDINGARWYYIEFEPGWH